MMQLDAIPAPHAITVTSRRHGLLQLPQIHMCALASLQRQRRSTDSALNQDVRCAVALPWHQHPAHIRRLRRD